MPIDYIKARLLNLNIPQLLESDKLDFKTEYSRSTSEIDTTKYKAKIHFCEIIVFNSGRVMFTGSIHKMYNSIKGITSPKYENKKDTYNGYNGNTLHLDEVLCIRKYLSTLLNTTPNNIIFENMEFGTNIKTHFNPNDFINSLLFQYGKRFEFRYENNYAEVRHSRYKIKLYNKSNQYGMTNHTLRIEIKITKSIELKKIGIRTFADIDTNTLKTAEQLLLKKFDEIVYIDPTIRIKELTAKNKATIKLFRDVRYWLEDLKPNHRQRPLKKLHHFNSEHSDNLHSKIKTGIIKKCVTINRPHQVPNCVISNSSNRELNITHKKCPITGIDISEQRHDSFLLSNKGLKYLEKTDSEIFNHLKEILLTGNNNIYEKTIYCKMSKQIRNRYFNNRALHSSNQLRFF
jgi:hypothetical protein